MAELDQAHIDALYAHSITSWKRVYTACGFAFVVTFVSSVLLGSTPLWNAVTGIGFLFSILAILFAAASVGFTTYFENRAKHDFQNSLFARSTLPLEILIMKDVLKPSDEPVVK